MASIAENARIIRKGRVTSPKALAEVVAPHVETCALPGCETPVSKPGNTCSMTCYTAVKSIVESVPVEVRAQIHAERNAALSNTVEETPVSEHIAPCKDMLNGCIDLECQVRKGLRDHLMWNVSQDKRAKASEVSLIRLDRLLNDAEHGDKEPEWFLAQAIEAISDWFSSGEPLPPYPHQRKRTSEEERQNVARIRKPQTAKHQPRITDNQEHPVTVTEQTITLTKSEMERAISTAAERLVQERIDQIIAAKATAPAPEDKPVEIVSKKGGRKKVERAAAKDREFAGVTLAEIVVDKSLTVPALEVGEESLDTVVSSKVRSPYNKARFRLDAEATVLDAETTTYRVLMAEHKRLSALAAAKPAKAKAKKEAKKVVVQAVVDPKRLAKIAALVTELGMTREQAEAIVG